ncbi:MAG: serine protease [Betaproteobacteria bacterium]|nr:serine protease [Betaproteobacteria bacterium]
MTWLTWLGLVRGACRGFGTAGRRGAASRMVTACAGMVAAAVLAGQPAVAGEAPAQGEGGERKLTVDVFSVVKLRVKALSDARSRRTLGAEREGSGIVIDSNGLILTIGYLIQEAATVELLASDGRPVPASVIAYDYATGFGLLRALKPLSVRPIALGESSRIADKQPVLIVGFDGVAPAFVVSRRQFAGYWEYLLDEAIFTAPATINWSGAALIDSEGKLLGVGSLIVTDAMGPRSQIPGNMFVPIDLIKPILGDLIATGKSTGHMRPWIGVLTQNVQGKLMVTRVSPDGPAEQAGLAAGDIIVGVGGKPIDGQADFYRKLWASGEAGAEVVLDVVQGAQLRQVAVRSTNRDHYLRPRPIY